MKTAKKVWIIIAVCLIVAGIIIGVSSLAILNFDFTLLPTEKFIESEQQIAEDFNNIKIDVYTSDIKFVLSSDERCRVICVDTDKTKHTVTVKDDTLLISVEDSRKWYDHIGISLGNTSLTVVLPKDSYNSLDIEADTSDITVTNDLTFNTASIETDTGDVAFSANMLGALDISTDTGHMGFSNIKAQNIMLESDMGDITFNSVECENVSVENDTGDVRLNNTIVTQKMTVTTSTGDVKFDYSDAEEISVCTSTGDVIGNLLSSKVFMCQTDTGRVNVPKTIEGGKCEITTDTGDIKIEIEK